MEKSKKTPNELPVNIEDLMIFEDKLNEIIFIFNNSSLNISNECFDFLNYYNNCSFNCKLENLFKTEGEKNNVISSIKYLLISLIICYDFCFEKDDIIYKNFSILSQILGLNHRNIIVIFEYFFGQIILKNMSNPWILELKKMIEYYNDIYENEYIIKGKKILNYMGKIQYNISIIDKNIRDLFNHCRIGENDYLNILFKNIEKQNYEEINSFFEEKILRVNHVSDLILATTFIKENKYLKTEPSPYIRINNLKPLSLILELNQTLMYFKLTSEDGSEGILKIRPGTLSFLDSVGKFYELIIFSTESQDFVDLITDAIEEDEIYFDHRLYRQHTLIRNNNFIKDLTMVGRPLDKTIIVDNMPKNFALQKENEILIKSFYGEDKDDNALEELGKILVNIAK